MRVIVHYRELCAAGRELGGLEGVRRVASGEWRDAAARHVGGFASRVLHCGTEGGALIEIPDDPTGLLLP